MSPEQKVRGSNPLGRTKSLLFQSFRFFTIDFILSQKPENVSEPYQNPFMRLPPYQNSRRSPVHLHCG
jgi:hypothetical protein